MIRGYLVLFSVLFLLMGSLSFSFADSIEKASILNQHGLIREAKLELINVLFSKESDTNKAQAYYLLGSIAFDENRISVALDSWRELSKRYPNSEQALIVKDRIDELAEIVGEYTKDTIQNAIALSYMRHGDFWSKGKSSILMIDSSWIPNVEASIKWYDKVISEFPNSYASLQAYQEKIRTLLGWETSGGYPQSYGIKSSFIKYMPILLDTFNSFEKDHPDAPNLQAYRYQIAQVYWRNKNWSKTREWLNIIIEKAGDGDSFYKDLAERRLQKIEY